MRLFHTLGVHLYGLGISLAQPFVPKARQWKQGRHSFWKNLPAVPNQKVVWFHCASLGEFDQGIPVMQQLKAKDPSIYLIVTFFSPSGMDFYQKRNHPADWVGYLPLPTNNNAKKFIRHFHPQQVFFVKYEFWDNYLAQAKKIGAKIYCISATFRRNQRFFGSFGFLFKKTLQYFDRIFVQNKASLELLENIGISTGFLAGDTRVDKVLENKAKIYPDEVATQFLDGRKVIILGSCWPQGEQIWREFIFDHPEFQYIIAPHNVNAHHIESLLKDFYPQGICYTKFDINKKTNVLIVDCIGKLSNLYQYGDLAYVGGGFTGKLHNILEPSVFGIPIVIGPKHARFPEAEELIQRGVTHVIENPKEVTTIVPKLLEKRAEIAQIASEFFEENKDAARKIVNKIEDW